MPRRQNRNLEKDPKSGIWKYRKMVRGKSRKVSLRTRDQVVARRRAADYERKLANGEAAQVFDRTTVAMAVPLWLEKRVAAKRNAKGLVIARRRAELYLLPQLGGRRMASLTFGDVEDYRKWLDKQGLSPQTVMHILADLRNFLRWAEKRKYFAASPFSGEVMPTVKRRPPDRLTEEEEAAVRAIPEPWSLVVRFLLASGLRWSEACRATASDIQRDGTLLVRETKSGEPRDVPLPFDLAQEMRLRFGPLVPFSGNSLSAFTRAVRRHSGVRRFHAHQCRHTFACKFLEAGGSIVALQAILGHGSVAVTERYGRADYGTVRAEAEKVHQELKRRQAVAELYRNSSQS